MSSHPPGAIDSAGRPGWPVEPWPGLSEEFRVERSEAEKFNARSMRWRHCRRIVRYSLGDQPQTEMNHKSTARSMRCPRSITFRTLACQSQSVSAIER